MEHTAKTISLTEVPEGASCDLVGWGTLPPEDIRKLTDVGIRLGLPLTVANTTPSGPVVLAINESHIAIGKDAAAQMQVLCKAD